MTQIVAICIQKGGVGKTAVTINLGAALAAADKRILLVDFDPQGYLTEGIGLQDLYLDGSPTLYDCLASNAKPAFPSLLHKAPGDDFSVIPLPTA